MYLITWSGINPLRMRRKVVTFNGWKFHLGQSNNDRNLSDSVFLFYLIGYKQLLIDFVTIYLSPSNIHQNGWPVVIKHIHLVVSQYLGLWRCRNDENWKFNSALKSADVNLKDLYNWSHWWFTVYHPNFLNCQRKSVHITGPKSPKLRMNKRCVKTGNNLSVEKTRVFVLSFPSFQAFFFQILCHVLKINHMLAFNSHACLSSKYSFPNTLAKLHVCG